MPPKELNRHQLSSKLSYSQHTPNFLLKFQNRVAGIPDEDEDPEFEDDGSGRPPIPRRPAIPERPSDDPGSADEDEGDERPQVVVLREGKHLTAREAENVRRKERGLPPLSDPEADKSPASGTEDKQAPSEKDAVKAKTPSQSLSFSSSSSSSRPTKQSTKRKAVGEPDDSKAADVSLKGPAKKKPKKPKKGLLSFGDDT